jgi:SAM-dependent methyltransferase
MGEVFLNCSDIAMPALEPIEFTCNICAEKNRSQLSGFDRERPTCAKCGSNVRSRAIIHMLARELFGADIALPDFPTVKSIRGIGLSDFCYAAPLAEKLGYTNTFYHKEPAFDILKPRDEHVGAFDFLISTEVFEHVAPPVEIALRNAHRVLKPNGILLLTVPYTLDETTAEHFRELFDYGLAQLHDRIVLVNRTRGGELQVFENLCFHGGHGSTLEMRRFTERDLRGLIPAAGFLSLRIYSENYLPFGIVHNQHWSLPMAARKQPFALNLSAAGEIIEQWTERVERARRLHAELQVLTTGFKAYEEWAKNSITNLEQDLAERTAWARGFERELEERTQWALTLDSDLKHHIELAGSLQSESEGHAQRAQVLQNEVNQLRRELDALKAAVWTRAGRRLRVIR